MKRNVTLAALSGAIAVLPALRGSHRNADRTERRATDYLDSIVTANAYEIRLEGGRFTGPGAGLLLNEASRAQCLLLGEEHNALEIPQLVGALFDTLQKQAGYHYVALEQDPLTMELASRAPMRGQVEALAAYSRRYPFAFTFVSDQELAMIAHIGAVSRGHADPIWGLDQSFGAAHSLDRLLAIGGPRVSPAARALAMHYRDTAMAKERVRDLEKFDYMAAEKTENFARLDSLWAPAPGSDAAFILDNLASSDAIYRAYRERRGYDNGYVREEQMKQLFMREYRRAQHADGAAPKVIVKMGHWHVYRGEGPSNLQTLGNFVSELARANGGNTFHLAIHSHNPPGGFRSLSAWADSLPDPMIAHNLPTDRWTIVDLRPLRAHFGRIASALRADQRDQFRRLVFGFDAELFVGGMRPASYAFNPGVEY